MLSALRLATGVVVVAAAAVVVVVVVGDAFDVSSALYLLIVSPSSSVLLSASERFLRVCEPDQRSHRRKRRSKSPAAMGRSELVVSESASWKRALAQAERREVRLWEGSIGSMTERRRVLGLGGKEDGV